MFFVWAFRHTTDISTTSVSQWMSHERVPTFPRGGLPELLPLHKQPVSCNFLLQSIDRLPCKWKLAISSSEMTLYKSNGIRLR